MRWISLLLCAGLLAACQSNPFGGDVPDSLYYQVQTFEDTVRWGNLDNMYLFLKREGDAEVEVQKGLSNVRVTGYESSPPRKLDEYRWALTAVIFYVLRDRQVERQVVDQQVWESDDEGKTWLRSTPVPQFQ